MRLPELVRGSFVQRDNRFRATVIVAGAQTAVHVANSGRLTELLTPGRPVWLVRAVRTERRTAYDLALVEHEGTLVSVDARLPNALWAEAVMTRPVLEQRFDHLEREVARGASRLDFRLANSQGVCWVEVKSVTLVEREIARFPDAVTVRGVKHLGELIAITHAGEQAAVVFVVQRGDAARFKPHYDADPLFAKTLRLARQAGVGVWAYTCRVSQQEIVLAEPIPGEL